LSAVLSVVHPHSQYMQLKLHIFLVAGNRFIPSDTPSLLLFTGPKIILSNKNVDILFTLVASN